MVNDGGSASAVLWILNGLVSQYVYCSDSSRCGRVGAAAWSCQYDAGRLSEPFAETDAVAGLASVRRHRHHHAHRLDLGPLNPLLKERRI